MGRGSECPAEPSLEGVDPEITGVTTNPVEDSPFATTVWLATLAVKVSCGWSASTTGSTSKPKIEREEDERTHEQDSEWVSGRWPAGCGPRLGCGGLLSWATLFCAENFFSAWAKERCALGGKEVACSGADGLAGGEAARLVEAGFGS